MPDQSLSPETREAIKKIIESIPSWISTRFKSLFLVLATSIELISYMLMHWIVGRFFGDYIAHNYPTLRRLLDDVSAGTFFTLIVKSLLELLWESFAPLMKRFAK